MLMPGDYAAGSIVFAEQLMHVLSKADDNDER